MGKKIAIVNTSAAFFDGDKPTGVWLEELSAPYYIFKEAGFEVTVASIAGGPIPIDQGSVSGDFFTDSAKKFLHDAEAIGALAHSVPLAKIAPTIESDYDVLYLPGGHGCCTDFVDNKVLKECIEKMYNAPGKFVAADCHGPISLAQCCKADGSPLVKGLKVTGFSDSEEGAVGLTGAVPFLIQGKFVEQGANFENAADWNSCAVQDGALITGQNPQSSEACANLVVKALA